MQVHQFNPTVSYGDAASNHTLAIQQMIGALGYKSEIFCDRMPLHFEGQVKSLTEYKRYSSPKNVLLCHFALSYSPRVIAWLKTIPDRKVLIYHNITPARYFAGINHSTMMMAQQGRRQLKELCALTDAGWGVSDYNCQELAEVGWTRLGILPIVFEPRHYAVRPDRQVLDRWQGGFNVLFVGRIAPNKCIEDLILTFYYLKRYVRRDARLLLVGSAGRMEPYLAFLKALVEHLSLSDVVFTGHVSNEQLMAYYRCANVYLSMSEHEGFGVPFLESMHFGVPIVAYKAAAVSETLGDCGILVTRKDHRAIAELIGVLGDDADLHAHIVNKQQARLQNFAFECIKPRLQALLTNLDNELPV